MPRICTFYGITIWMFYDEAAHIGRRLFHARYGDHEPIETAAMTDLPSNAMRSTPLLLDATPVSGNVVLLRFEDGAAGEVDLGYLLGYGGVFEPLRDQTFFRHLRTDPEAGTIVWPNGADVAPETLYDLVCSTNVR